MRHAAHKATGASGQRNGSNGLKGLFATARGSHTRGTVIAMQMAEGNGAVLGLEPSVADKLNELAPMTRRSIREAARAAERRNFIIGSASLAALAGTAATAVAFANPLGDDLPSLAGDQATTTTQIQPVKGAASRSDVRTPLVGTAASDTASSTTDSATSGTADASAAATQQGAAAQGGRSGVTDTTVTEDGTVTDGTTQQTSNDGSWSLGDANTALDSKLMSRSLADNPNVAKLMDQDADVLPAGFNPNHATGDVGNAYEFSQCTWWVYVRRHDLGLPAGSHMGNGNMWANSARALGYWVDNTPRHVGDIMVFRAGQEGTDSTYGHVAIVEKINADGSITTSECGSVMNGKTYSKTYHNVSDFEYIHY